MYIVFNTFYLYIVHCIIIIICIVVDYVAMRYIELMSISKLPVSDDDISE